MPTFEELQKRYGTVPREEEPPTPQTIGQPQPSAPAEPAKPTEAAYYAGFDPNVAETMAAQEQRYRASIAPEDAALLESLDRIHAERDLEAARIANRFQGIQDKIDAGAAPRTVAPELFENPNRFEGPIQPPNVFTKWMPPMNAGETMPAYRARLDMQQPEVGRHLRRWEEEYKRRVLVASLNMRRWGGHAVQGEVDEQFKDFEARGMQLDWKLAAIRDVKAISGNLAKFKKDIFVGAERTAKLGYTDRSIIDLATLSPAELQMFNWAVKMRTDPQRRGLIEEFVTGVQRGMVDSGMAINLLGDAADHAFRKNLLGTPIDQLDDPITRYARESAARGIVAQEDPLGTIGGVGQTVPYMAVAALGGEGIGGVAAIATLETPDIAAEMSDKGVPPATAAVLAPLGGVLTGYLERAQFGALVPGKTKPILQDQFRNAFANAAVRYGMRVTEEVSEEVLQEVTKVALTDVGQWAHGQGPDIGDAWDEMAKRVVDTIDASGGVMAILSAVGAPIDIAQSRAMVQQAQIEEVSKPTLGPKAPPIEMAEDVEAVAAESKKKGVEAARTVAEKGPAAADFLEKQGATDEAGDIRRAVKRARSIIEEADAVELPPKQAALEAPTERGRVLRKKRIADLEGVLKKRRKAYSLLRGATVTADRVAEYGGDPAAITEDIQAELDQIEKSSKPLTAEIDRLREIDAEPKAEEELPKQESRKTIAEEELPKQEFRKTIAGEVAQYQKGLRTAPVERGRGGRAETTPIIPVRRPVIRNTGKRISTALVQRGPTAPKTTPRIEAGRAPNVPLPPAIEQKIQRQDHPTKPSMRRKSDAQVVYEIFKQRPEYRAVVDPKTGKVTLPEGRTYIPLSEARGPVEAVFNTKEGVVAHEAGHVAWDRVPQDVRDRFLEVHRQVSEQTGMKTDAQEEFSHAYSLNSIRAPKWRGRVAAYDAFMRENAAVINEHAPPSEVSVREVKRKPKMSEAKKEADARWAAAEKKAAKEIVGERVDAAREKARKGIAVSAVEKEIASVQDELEQLAIREEQTGEPDPEGRISDAIRRLQDAEYRRNSMLDGFSDADISEAIKKLKFLSTDAPTHLQAQLRNEMPTPAQAQKLASDVDQGVAEVKAKLGSKFKGDRKPRMKQSAAWYFAVRGNLRPETIVEMLAESDYSTQTGHTSVVGKMLIEKLAEGDAAFHRHYTELQDIVVEGYQKAGLGEKEMRAANEEKVTIPLKGAADIDMTVDEALTAVLTARDTETAADIASMGATTSASSEARKLTGDVVAAIETFLQKKHPKLLKWAKDMQKRIMAGEGAKKTSSAHMRSTGRELPFNQSHFPRFRDGRHIAGLEAKEAIPDGSEAHIDLMTSTFGGDKQLTQQHEVRARVKTHPAPFLIRPFSEVLAEHVQRVANYAGKAVVVRDANLLIHDPRFRQAMVDGMSDGDKVWRQLKEHFQEYKAIDARYRPDPEKAIGFLLRNSSKAVLAGLRVPIYQGVSLANAHQEMPLNHIRGALLGGSYKSLSDNALKQMMPSVWQRFQGAGYMLTSPALQSSGRDAWRSFYRFPQKTLDWAMMGPIQKVDKETIRVIATGCYEWAKADGLKGQELYAEAEKRTNRVIRRSQPTMDAMTMSHLQLWGRKNPAVKPLVMFTSQANQGFNQAARAIEEFRRSEGKVGDYAAVARDVLRPTLVTGLMVHIISKGVGALMPGKRPEDWWDHVGGVLDRSIGGWIGGREIVYTMRKAVEDLVKKKGKIPWPKLRDSLLKQVIVESSLAASRALETVYAGMFKRHDVLPRMGEFADRLIRAMSLIWGLPGLVFEAPLRPYLNPKGR